MSDAQPTSGQVDNEMLSNYLQNHIIAANSGKRLFEEAAKVWSGTPHGPTFERLSREVTEDSDELERIAKSLGAELPPHKQATAWIGEQASKLGPLNPAHAPGGHPGQLELEGLISAVTGKSLLWETLLLLADQDTRIEALTVERLHDRALRQIRDISEVMRSTAKARFRAGADASS
ncbi:hypothetical protein [Sinomonas terrae]|uniref:DUF892 family protein n=1 Tax=Sinomonas terrae TaxID=2908838 RepID=A0ABS9U561_9MICC|nr:hypothetical protein [Sinomonas terrae]MCH6471828.1 hypothetical protein [Sinomonas terrae]